MVYARAESGLSNFREKFKFQFKGKNQNGESKTFIIPSGFGLAFAAVSLVLLFMAIGYANNLIYLYVFALISTALTSMFLTNRNVERVHIQGLYPGPLFANENSRLDVSLVNNSSTDCVQLEIFFIENQDAAQTFLVGSRSSESFSINCKLPVRGRTKLPRLTMQSRFPFGLLTAWKYFYPGEDFLVYPERKGNSNFPQSSYLDQEQGQMGIFRDHRTYQSSDSPRRIDWKATAKTGDLLVKNFEGADQIRLHFDWKQTAHLKSFESRVSQLSLWVSLAHQNNLSFSLTLTHFQSGFDSGENHFRKCMEVLALYKDRP